MAYPTFQDDPVKADLLNTVKKTRDLCVYLERQFELRGNLDHINMHHIRDVAHIVTATLAKAGV